MIANEATVHLDKQLRVTIKLISLVVKLTLCEKENSEKHCSPFAHKQFHAISHPCCQTKCQTFHNFSTLLAFSD